MRSAMISLPALVLVLAGLAAFVVYMLPCWEALSNAFDTINNISFG